MTRDEVITRIGACEDASEQHVRPILRNALSDLILQVERDTRLATAKRCAWIATLNGSLGGAASIRDDFDLEVE